MSVAAAMKDARVDTDARGLMPIERAREVLAGASSVDRGSLDEVWAALLSLDAAELVSATQHLDWQHPVRGRENLALTERYGRDALPWLQTRLREGVLVNHPWCVLPCLLALDVPEALELLLSVDGVLANAGDMKFWQFTPADPAVDRARLERDALDAVLEWTRRHEAAAIPVLAAQALSNPRAKAALTRLSEQRPGDLARLLTQAGAGALVATLGLPTSLTPAAILRVLDEACSAKHGLWPWFNMGVDGRCEYFGLRLIAVRAREGDGWGVVLERLMGCDPDSFQIARYAYGPGAANEANFDHICSLEMALEIVPPEGADEGSDTLFHGSIAKGPAGDLVLDESLFAKHDLKPEWATEFGGWPARTAATRAYLLEHPRAFWADPAEALPAAGVVDGEILFVSEAFAHVSGPAVDGAPTAPWSIFPSASETYRSLAEALLSRDPSRFVPGEDNLDFRLHATESQDFAPPWRTHRSPVGSGYLPAAMAETGATLDSRGLLPLEDARALLRDATTLARGEGRRAESGAWVWDLDRTWAALLSLESAEEAASVFARLTLAEPPRGGAANTALTERYGSDALRLVRAKADAAGVIFAESPLLRALVLAVPGPEGFAFVWDIAGWREPPSEESPDAQATALFAAWMTAHPETGYVELARLAEGGDGAAAAFLLAWATPQVRKVYRWLERGLGAERALAILTSAGLSCELSAPQITAVFDVAVAASAWPRLRTGEGPSRELHGMRLCAARARGEADWVVVLERLEGYGRNLKVERFLYGERVPYGVSPEHRVTLSLQTSPATTVDPLDARLVEPPDYWTKIDGAPGQIAAIRAALRTEPEKLWPPAEQLLASLGFVDRSVTIITTHFAHVTGEAGALPSASTTYRTLAEALAAEDPERFEAGESNVDPRLHARDLDAATDDDEDDEDDEDES